MSELLVFLKDKFEQKFEISETLKIGCKHDNDVVLAGNDIEAYHAVIYRRENGVYNIQCRSPKADIVIDGKNYKRYPLVDGDEFRIGDYSLKIDDMSDSAGLDKVYVTPSLVVSYDTRLENGYGDLSDRDEKNDSRQLSKRLQSLLTLSNHLVSSLDYNEVAQKALATSIELLDAKRGFIALVE